MFFKGVRDHEAFLASCVLVSMFAPGIFWKSGGNCYQVSKEQFGVEYLFYVPLQGHKALLVVNLLT